jgi:hypothetical protein
MKKNLFFLLLIPTCAFYAPSLARDKKKRDEKNDLSLGIEAGWKLRAPTEKNESDHRVFRPYGQFECGPSLTFIKTTHSNIIKYFGTNAYYDFLNKELSTRSFINIFYFRFDGKLNNYEENELAIGIRPKLYHYKFSSLVAFVEFEALHLGFNAGVSVDIDILKYSKKRIHLFEE